MNPIFIEYYSHEGCDCYKIRNPWTRYAQETMALCKVSEGYDRARVLAEIQIIKYFKDSTHFEP